MRRRDFIPLFSAPLASAQFFPFPGPGRQGSGGGGGTSIAVVTRASITDDTANSTITSPSANSTGANTIIVAVEWGAAGTVAVADTPNGAFTACPNSNSAVASGSLQMFYKQNATTSTTHTITATFDGSRPFRRMMVWFLSGGNTSSVIDAGCNAATGTTSPGATASLTPSGSGGMIIAAISNNDGINCTFTANNGFSLAFGSNGTLKNSSNVDTATFDTNAIEKLGATGAQTPSVGMTAIGGDWRMVAVALKPAP